MQIQIEKISSTESHLTIVAVEKEILASQNKVVALLAKDLKVAGFRPGKAPAHLAAKELDQRLLQEEFLKRFVPQAVEQALTLKKVEPLITPEVAVVKFVPGQTLELKVTVFHLGKVEVADYKHAKEELPEVQIKKAEIDDVIQKIRLDFATYKEVKRAAKDGDRLWLDFEGQDEKGQVINGAKATNYNLILGSQTLIPGFEEKLVGQVAEAELKFELRFPDDYLPRLAGTKVKFQVKVQKVEEVVLPKLDKDLFQKVGSFQTLSALKDFISQRLKEEKTQRSRQVFEGRVVAQLARASTIEIPAKVVEQEVNKIKQEHQLALQNNKLTAEQWLKDMKLTAEAHETEMKQMAEERIKGGLVLRQTALKEQISVEPQEVEGILEAQTKEGASEADKTRQRQDIQARLLTQKALRTLGDLVLQGRQAESSQ